MNDFTGDLAGYYGMTIEGRDMRTAQNATQQWANRPRMGDAVVRELRPFAGLIKVPATVDED